MVLAQSTYEVCDLILNRQLRARLGLIRPDLSRKIFDKCSDQKSKTDKGSNEREFTRDLLWNRYLDLMQIVDVQQVSLTSDDIQPLTSH